MEAVVSGIRPTGNLHLGNYFGAMKNFLKMQNEYNCYFFIADYHSLTTHPKAEHLHENVKQVLAEYLACGLNPEKATLYIQSDIPEIPELYLILNMFAHVGELERSTSYKEKIEKQKENINAGLLTYPVLMAADILIHKAMKVPVGKDQKQHLEMARTFGNRFNFMYGVNYFPEPQAFNFTEELVKIPGLDGSGKMGKSEGEGNAIFLIDEPEAIRKKVMKAVTDAGPKEKNQQKPEIIQNLFSLMEVVSTADTVKHFDEQYNNCTIRYGDMKKQLAEDMIKFTTPIREKVKSIASNEKFLHDVLEKGTAKAKASASKTMKEVREIIGIKKFKYKGERKEKVKLFLSYNDNGLNTIRDYFLKALEVRPKNIPLQMGIDDFHFDTKIQGLDYTGALNSFNKALEIFRKNYRPKSNIKISTKDKNYIFEVK